MTSTGIVGHIGGTPNPAKPEPNRIRSTHQTSAVGGRLRRLLSERYRERLAGVLSCYDRIIVTGTLPGVCYAALA